MKRALLSAGLLSGLLAAGVGCAGARLSPNRHLPRHTRWSSISGRARRPAMSASTARSAPHLRIAFVGPTKLVTNVTKPTLTIYRPAKEKNTGTAMLICPGGGYWNLFWELEGEEVAAWLNSQGMTGIILKYRVPRRPASEGRAAAGPLQDAQRAVSLVRSKAEEWGIDPQRIGMVGFSAGGHLAIATATSFEKRTYEPIDAIDKVSCRPDFAIVCYSGYLKAKDKDEIPAGHAHSRRHAADLPGPRSDDDRKRAVQRREQRVHVPGPAARGIPSSCTSTPPATTTSASAKTTSSPRAGRSLPEMAAKLESVR